MFVNYLKAIDIEVGLLFNFGKKAEFKRKVLTNEYKSEKLNSNADIYEDYDQLRFKRILSVFIIMIITICVPIERENEI